MLVALRKKVSMYNLSDSSDTCDTVALAALCDSQLLISGKQLKVRLSLESHRLRLKTTHALTLILTWHWYSRHSKSEVGGTTATCGAPGGDHRVMVRGRQMVQLPVTSTAVMCCSVSPRSKLSAGPAVDIGRYYSTWTTCIVKFSFFGKNPSGPFIHITWYH